MSDAREHEGERERERERKEKRGMRAQEKTKGRSRGTELFFRVWPLDHGILFSPPRCPVPRLYFSACLLFRRNDIYSAFSDEGPAVFVHPWFLWNDESLIAVRLTDWTVPGLDARVTLAKNIRESSSSLRSIRSGCCNDHLCLLSSSCFLLFSLIPLVLSSRENGNRSNSRRSTSHRDDGRWSKKAKRR